MSDIIRSKNWRVELKNIQSVGCPMCYSSAPHEVRYGIDVADDPDLGYIHVYYFSCVECIARIYAPDYRPAG